MKRSSATIGVRATPAIDAWMRQLGYGLSSSDYIAQGSLLSSLFGNLSTSGGTSGVVGHEDGVFWRVSNPVGDATVVGYPAGWGIPHSNLVDAFSPMAYGTYVNISLSASVAGMIAWAGITRSNQSPRGVGVAGVPFHGFVADPSVSANWLLRRKLGAGTGFASTLDTGIPITDAINIHIVRASGQSAISSIAALNGTVLETVIGANVPVETSNVQGLFAIGLGTAVGVNLDVKRITVYRRSLL